METLKSLNTAQKIAGSVVIAIFIIAVVLSRLNLAGFDSTQFSF